MLCVLSVGSSFFLFPLLSEVFAHRVFALSAILTGIMKAISEFYPKFTLWFLIQVHGRHHFPFSPLPSTLHSHLLFSPGPFHCCGFTRSNQIQHSVSRDTAHARIQLRFYCLKCCSLLGCLHHPGCVVLCTQFEVCACRELPLSPPDDIRRGRRDGSVPKSTRVVERKMRAARVGKRFG